MKGLHILILGFLFSILTWKLTYLYVKEMTFTEYFLLQIILVLSLKLYTFTILKIYPKHKESTEDHNMDQEDSHP